MSFLFSSPPPTYAEERLGSQLASLSTLPVNLTTSLSPHKDRPSPALESALSELTSSKPPNRQELRKALQSLINADEKSGGASGYVVQSEIDRVVESEVIARALTIVWKEVLDELLAAALQLEREKIWWDGVLNSRQGVAIYLLQSGCIRVSPCLD